MIVSKHADDIIEQAKDAYAVSLISERQLERIIKNALTIPGYYPYLDGLPFAWTIAAAKA